MMVWVYVTLYGGCVHVYNLLLPNLVLHHNHRCLQRLWTWNFKLLNFKCFFFNFVDKSGVSTMRWAALVKFSLEAFFLKSISPHPKKLAFLISCFLGCLILQKKIKLISLRAKACVHERIVWTRSGKIFLQHAFRRAVACPEKSA